MISARRYAREIEARWSALLDRPVVFGERDWALICDWHARGIPLALIDEAFEQFADKIRRWRRSPRNLGAVAPLIEEAWRAVREGRSEPGADDEAAAADPRAVWERSIGDLEAGDALGEWLRGLLRRHLERRSAAACEATLRAGLVERLPAALRAELELEVTKELEPFRDRMSRETWHATRDAALLSAARRRLGLPVLSDPAPSPKTDETF